MFEFLAMLCAVLFNIVIVRYVLEPYLVYSISQEYTMSLFHFSELQMWDVSRYFGSLRRLRVYFAKNVYIVRGPSFRKMLLGFLFELWNGFSLDLKIPLTLKLL
jgi:hypothetical protein